MKIARILDFCFQRARLFLELSYGNFFREFESEVLTGSSEVEVSSSERFADTLIDDQGNGNGDQCQHSKVVDRRCQNTIQYGVNEKEYR